MVLAFGILALGFFYLVWVIFLTIFVVLDFEKNKCIVLKNFAAHLFLYFLFWIIYILLIYYIFPHFIGN